jgi:glycosyltransferase involved in cell wall biosynthesis
VRVLYVNHTATVSGSERSLLSLLAALPPSVQASVACPPGRLAEEVEELAIPVTPITATAGSLRLHPAHTPRALAEMSLAALQVHRAARRHGAEVVHANSIRAGIELGLAHVSPAASLVHVRDCLPPGRATTATMRMIAATATTVVANSHYTAASVRRFAPSARIEVVHPGIDTTRFDPALIDRAAARARLGVAGTRALLGVVAQLTPWKGQDTAIEALRLLRDQGVDAHLLLIGSAKFVATATRFDNEAYVAQLRRQIADAGLEDRVSWLGEREDVPELMRALDALLLPSHEEPFGRSLLEAMALEVPVLATNVGGPPELIRDGSEGYLLPPLDAAAWAQAARGVIGSPEHRRELGRAGRRRIAQAFDIPHHVQAMLAVYERAGDRRRSAA